MPVAALHGRAPRHPVDQPVDVGRRDVDRRSVADALVVDLRAVDGIAGGRDLAGLLQEGEVSAVSGDVAIRLLSGSPLRIKTSTLSGTVRCRAVSDPSVPYSLKVKTVSGDIRID